MHRRYQLFLELKDRQALPLLLDRPAVLDAKQGRFPKGFGFPFGQLVAREPHAAELLCQVPLALLGHRVLPRPVKVLWDRL